MTLKLWAIWAFGALIVLSTGLRYPTEGSTVTVVFASPQTAMMAIERLAALDAVVIDAPSTGRIVAAWFDATPSPRALHAAGILAVFPQGAVIGCRQSIAT